MTNESLYLISMTDGDVYLTKTTLFAMQQRLDDSEFTGSDFFPDFVGMTNLTETEGFILIRGEIVLPKPVSTVTRWKL